MSVFDGATVVYSYTRADAIGDGTLVDVTTTASEAGFAVPVAITRAAYEDCVAWTDADAEFTRAVQDEAGRLWDVLTMARFAAARAADARRVEFGLVRVPRDVRTGGRARRALLVAVCGPGDSAEPVITIMRPDED